MQFIDGPGNDIVNVYLDGVLVHTGTTWEDYYRDFAGGIPFPVDSIMFREAGTAVPATLGKGFLIDNFSSYSGPAPVSTATLHVIKLVINNSGGTGISSDFSIHLKHAGVDVAGSPVIGTSAPGTPYTVAPGTYDVSEFPNNLYTQSFLAGDCSNGTITLLTGDDKSCTIINTDIPPLPPLPQVGGITGTGPAPIVPLIGISQIPTPNTLSANSGSVTYAYSVWNVGKLQPLVNVRATDDNCTPLIFLSGDTNNNSKLDPDETWNYSCKTNLSKTTTNTATVTGYSDDPYYLRAISTSIVTVPVFVPNLPNTGSISPLINIINVPSRLTPFPVGGGTVMYTYTITNPGVVPISNVGVFDNNCNSVSFISGDINNNNLLDPGEIWTYTCQTNITVSTMGVATVKGTSNGLTATGYAFATVLVSTASVPNTGLSQTEKAPVFNRSLSFGSSGADVTSLQTILVQKGFLVIPPGINKGYFGALTQAAVAEYQTSVELPSIGVFGPQTKAKIISGLGT